MRSTGASYASAVGDVSRGKIKTKAQRFIQHRATNGATEPLLREIGRKRTCACNNDHRELYHEISPEMACVRIME